MHVQTMNNQKLIFHDYMRGGGVGGGRSATICTEQAIISVLISTFPPLLILYFSGNLGTTKAFISLKCSLPACIYSVAMLKTQILCTTTMCANVFTLEL